MSTEANKALVRRYLEELWNNRDLSLADEIVNPTYVFHSQSVPEDLHGTEGVGHMVGMITGAFPDVEFTIEDLVAEGDTVAVRWSALSTHQGDYMGIAPTGKSVTVHLVAIHRVEDGKLAETWVAWDNLAVLRQIGAFPPPG